MRALSIIALGLVGCASSTAPDPGLEGLALSKVAPGTIIPGTKIVVKGESFVDSQWGAAVLHLQGGDVDVSWPATFVDFGTLNVAVDRGDLDQIGGDAQFHGTATVEYTATSDDQVYKTDPLTLDLTFKTQLTPTVTGVLDGVHFVNDPIEVDGDGFLLGANEGQTFARLTGCFQLDSGTTCDPIAQIDVAMQPLEELSRAKGQWAFLPKIAGIQPGAFTGQVTIVNRQVGGAEVAAAPVDVSYTMVTSQVFNVDPPAASLGQYVFVHGGGFVGGEANALTELELVGTFTKTGGTPAQISMHLIPDFVEGPLVRYVLNTDDELGHSLDLRKDTGHFTGTMTPIIHYGSDTARGTGAQVTFDIAPVKQVVYLNFEPAYVEELRDFGLRAVDKQIRDRILAVCNRSYKGVNIEFRTEPVTDFALFENVDLVGVDPNDMGLFGYDNSPGKDSGNIRLYDQLGGVNAVTQQDGYPGYGGVFVRSLMGFSMHPGSFAQKTPGADDNFDKTFDPFRPDVDGHPITSSDLATAPAVLADGTRCPGKDRATQISCAIYVMGNLVGGTLSHEIGHSLGLANPYADGFHDAGDAPNRLMDAGGDRPFLERAEILGQGPAVFCDDEYAYLRQIMPSNSPPDNSPRPSCF